MGKFKIGDRVKFVELDNHHELPSGKDLPMVKGWSVDGIPDSLIQHGKTTLHEDYNKEFALVVDIFDSVPHCNIVEYKGSNGKKVKLGFMDSSLELVNPIKFEVGDKVKLLSKTVLGYDKFTFNILQNDIGYINDVHGDPYNFNDDDNCFVVGKSSGCGGDFFALKDLELVEKRIVIGTKVKISVPRNHPDWKYDGKICTIKDVPHFWDDLKITKELYIIDIEDKKFTKEEFEVL